MLDKEQARRFASALKSYMDRYELSANHMARRSGVDAVMIGAYTHGAVIPSDSEACALLMATGMAPSEIDEKLGFAPGTAHDVTVDRWAVDKMKAMKVRMR